MSLINKLLFSALIVLLPTQLGLHFWPSWSLVNGTRVDLLAPTLYLTDILVLLIVGINVRSIRIPLPYLAGFLVFAALNIYYSHFPLLSLYKFSKLVEALFFGAVVYSQREMVLPLVKKWLPVTLLWTCFLAFLQVFNHGSINGLWYWLGERSFTTQTPGIALSKIMGAVSLRPYATLPHPNALAAFLALSWLFLKKQYEWSRFFVFFTAITFATIFLTESYTVWTGLVGVIIFQLCSNLLKKNTERFWKLFLTVLFVGSLASPYAISRFNLSLLDQQNIRERMELNLLGGYMTRTNTFFGYGLGSFIHAIPVYRFELPDRYQTRTYQLLQPIHNIPLLFFGETGLVGIVLLFLFILTLPVSTFLLFITITSLFDHYWITLQTPLLLLALTISLSCDIFLQKKPHT